MSDIQDLLARGFEPDDRSAKVWTRKEAIAELVVAQGLIDWTGRVDPTGPETLGCAVSGDTAREVVDKLEAFLALASGS
jgi:hypothetical protein